MKGNFASCIAAVTLALLVSAVSSELVLTYSIQRHGARNVLPKSAVLTENGAAGGPTLLPAGQQMCYEAGLAFNRRYISQASCTASRPPTCLSEAGREQYGVINKPGVGFSNYNSFANSSALDRAILSANSFLAGVFPHSATRNSSVSLEVVPVYSVPDSEDWRIRGYAKCPAYQQRLAAWINSDAFKRKEQETAALRTKVQALAPQLNTSLAMWWDVYDSFYVWRTYGVGNPMPHIDDDTFDQVVDLAMWLETAKMDPELTGNVLGGGLLGDILHHMTVAEQAVRFNSKAPYYKLLTVSSHYNTQLGLLSALQSAVPPSRRTQHPWLTKIPSLASVLVLELHSSSSSSSSSQLVVRAVYQDGPKAAYRAMPLPCAEKGDAAEAVAGPGSCTLQAFRALAEPAAFLAAAEWCEACSNSKVMECVVHSMKRQLAEVGGGSAAAGAGGFRTTKGAASPGMVAVWCVVSVVAAASLAGAGFMVARRVRNKRSTSLKQQLGHISGAQSTLSRPMDLNQSAPV